MSVPVVQHIKRLLLPFVRAGLHLGLPPSLVKYHVLLHESIDDHFERTGGAAGESIEVIQKQRTAVNALPANVRAREALPDESGWWGYSFRDVPTRTSGRTLIATLRNCTVLPARDLSSGEFSVGILTEDGRALDINEMRIGPAQEERLRSGTAPDRRESATWILERVYHNHSHWLTAHLPKLLLLRERKELEDVLMPPEMTDVMTRSMEMAGIDPDGFRRFEVDRPLEVESLRVLVTDRFRPELLRFARSSVSDPDAARFRRIYISREKAPRRRLQNESEILPRLLERGFERVFLEDLPFETQVRLMQEAEIVVAPHGAGLTNVLFCTAGTHVVEIADPGFPNPNFYALCAAMEHRYWIVKADSLGDAHPLERDLHVSPWALEDVLTRVESLPVQSGRRA